MAFGHRVRDIRLDKGLTQQELADLINVNQPVIGSIESRDSDTSKHASKIAKALAVDVDWLLSGKGSQVAAKETQYSISDTDVIDLHFYDDTAKRPLKFSQKTLDMAGVAANDAVAIDINSDDMEPMILDGSTIVVDTSKADIPIKNNRIYALVSGGEVRCKYIQRMAGGKIKLICKNPMYDDEIYCAEEFEALYKNIGWVFWWSTLAKW